LYATTTVYCLIFSFILQICKGTANRTKIFSFYLYLKCGGIITEGRLQTKMTMDIQHEENELRGRHFINDEEGNMIAEITYAVDHPDTMVVDHTEVNEDLQGKNIGYQLVQAVVEHARAKGRRIVPVCSFAKAVIEKQVEFQDVLG